MRVALLLLLVVSCSTNKVRLTFEGPYGMETRAVSREEAALIRSVPYEDMSLRERCTYWRRALATTPRRHKHYYAMAERGVRSCEPIARWEDLDAGEALVQDKLAGYTVHGEALTGRVEELARVHEVPMQRGRCYLLVVRFHDNVKPGDDLISGPRGWAKYDGIATSARLNTAGRVGVADLGCPQADAPATLEIESSQQLGTGTYTAQLHSKQITDERLAELAAANERSIREGEAWARRAQYVACTECTESARSCGAAIDRYVTGTRQPNETITPTIDECVSNYLSCLQRHGISIDSCSP